MLEGKLAFTHVGEAGFVDQGVGDRPGVAGVVLLIARSDFCAKSGDVRTGGLKVIEGLKLAVVGVVVVEAETLFRIDVVIETKGELILSVGTGGNGLIGDAVGTIGSGNEAKKVNSHRIHASPRDRRIAV